MTHLNDLRPGQRGKIAGWVGDPPTRLLELGLLPGTEVEVVRLAPLGDPMDVRVRGCHLTLRQDEAELIEIAS